MAGLVGQRWSSQKRRQDQLWHVAVPPHGKAGAGQADPSYLLVVIILLFYLFVGFFNQGKGSFCPLPAGQLTQTVCCTRENERVCAAARQGLSLANGKPM